MLRFWYLRSRLRLEHIRSVLPEAAIFAALIGLCLLAILETSLQHGSEFFYLLFLPVVIAALRHGIDGACVSLLATQIALVFLLQRYSFDAASFTEIQAKMFVLTATALSVGAVVSEREQARRAFQDAQEQLKGKEADAVRAGRFYLVSAMASALAHEINQPITAARAHARSVQQILRGTTPDLPRADRNLTTLVNQIDVAGNIVRRIREFLQRGPLMSDVDIRGMLEDALVLSDLRQPRRRLALISLLRITFHCFEEIVTSSSSSSSTSFAIRSTRLQGRKCAAGVFELRRNVPSHRISLSPSGTTALV